jgi:hypothetical protein
MDTTKIRFGEAVAAVSALLLFIIMFLPWYGYTAKGTSGLGFSISANRSAWQAYGFIDLILFVTIIVALGMVVLSMTQRSAALPVSASVVVAILGGVSVLLILFRIVSKPDYCRGGACASDFLNVSLKYGIFLGLITAGGIAVGAFLAMREEGTSFSDAAQRLQGGTGGGDAPPPAQPAQPAAPQPPAAPPLAPPTPQPPAAPPPQQPLAPQPPPAPPQPPPAEQPPGEQPPPATPPPSQPPPSQPPPGGGGPPTG